jgi:protein-S-isoprenylcysteine O-methyltransferase Ste14
MILSYQLIAFKYKKSGFFSMFPSAVRILFVSLHVFIVISNIVLFFNLIRNDFNPSTFSIAGLAFFTSGVSMIFWVMFFLRKAVFVPGKRLLIDGPFRIVRHPIYFGGITGAIGLAILGSSLLAVVYSIALAITLNHIADAEEDDLIIRFGKEYEEYMKKVPKLIPCIPHAW